MNKSRLYTFEEVEKLIANIRQLEENKKEVLKRRIDYLEKQIGHICGFVPKSGENGKTDGTK